MQRLRNALHAVNWAEVAPNFQATFSCGIASLPLGEKIEDLLQRADEALYRAKSDGRNCTRVD